MSYALTTWTIYDHPLDYPHHVVARQWIVDGGDPVPGAVIVGPSIEAIRQMIRPGLFCIPRSEEDDPFIVETWI